MVYLVCSMHTLRSQSLVWLSEQVVVIDLENVLFGTSRRITLLQTLFCSLLIPLQLMYLPLIYMRVLRLVFGYR